MTETPIYLSRYDHGRLRDILASSTHAGPTRMLAGELGRAIVLPEHARFPSTVVTIDSRVHLEDLRTGETFEVVVVLPGQGHPAETTVSVFDELGTALLGCSVGDVVSVKESGEAASMRLIHVVQSSLAEAAARLPFN